MSNRYVIWLGILVCISLLLVVGYAYNNSITTTRIRSDALMRTCEDYVELFGTGPSTLSDLIEVVKITNPSGVRLMRSRYAESDFEVASHRKNDDITCTVTHTKFPRSVASKTFRAVPE